MSFWKNCFLFNNKNIFKKSSSKDVNEETPLRSKDQNYLGTLGHIDNVPFHDEDGKTIFIGFKYFLIF